MESLLQSDAVGHAAHGVLALQNLKLSGSVLIKELVQGQVATANLDLNLVTHAHDAHALAAELINAVRLAHEHNLQLLPVGVVVDVLSELLVDRVILHGNVDRDTRLEIDDVLSQRLNFVLVVFHLLKHLELRRLRLVEFLLKLADVCRGALKLLLQLLLARLHVLMVGFPGSQLLLNIFLLRAACIELENGALQLERHILVPLEGDLQLADAHVERLLRLLHGHRDTLDLSVLLDAHLLCFARHLLQVLLVDVVDAGDLGLPGLILPFLLLLLLSHLVEMVSLFSSQPIVQVFELGQEVLLLGSEGSVSSCELRGVSLTKVFNLTTIAVFLGGQLVTVPLIETSMLIGTSSHFLVYASLILSEFTVPLILALICPVAKIGNLLVLAINLAVVPFVLAVQLLKMGLLSLSSLPLLFLDLIHQLLDLGLQTVLELLLHLRIFLDLLCGVCQNSLQLLSCSLAFANELLVLSDVVLQVIEDLEFLVEGNQCVQLVFKLNFLVFES